MWKLSTIILISIVVYIGYVYLMRYQSMEKEIEELRSKCTYQAKDVKESIKIEDKIKEAKNGLVATLEGILLKMPQE